jgi:hypothetical protein
MTAGVDNGLRNIPSRQMRTATVQAPQGVDPDVQQVLMEATRLNNQKINESGRVAGSGKRPVPVSAAATDGFVAAPAGAATAGRRAGFARSVD